MEIRWKITKKDVAKIQRIVESQKNNPFLLHRIELNVNNPPAKVTKSKLWYALVLCLLTTQQRSGPNSRISAFAHLRPYPLSLTRCQKADSISSSVARILTDFGGIRRAQSIGKASAANFRFLQCTNWHLLRDINKVLIGGDKSIERAFAERVREEFAGFGPKQSRNLLQTLGLTRYEIPVDSRITRWLNAFGFPLRLGTTPLSDPDYYNFVLDGIQAICESAGILPCVLDAAIFSSFDEGWEDSNVI